MKRNWLLSIFIISFAAVGTIWLISSFALTPGGPNELINTRIDQNSLNKVEPTIVNASHAKYSQTGIYPLSFEYPATWQLYKLKLTTASSGINETYLRLLSPTAKISGESHSSEPILTSGAMVEVSAFTNSQFTNVDEYADQLGDSAINLKKLTVGGKNVAEYQLTGEDQNGAAKTITTFFTGNIQYTISFSNSTKADLSNFLSVYQSILDNFSTQ